MKQNIGIWIDTSQAVVIKLSDDSHSLKIIESDIETRERVSGETKKFGRFGGQFITYERNRQNRKFEQTNLFLKELLKELHTCDAVVLFGPSNMKKIFEKEILKNMLILPKLKGVFNSELITQNQMVAWVKDFYKKNS